MPDYQLKLKFSGAALLSFQSGFVPGKVARYMIAEKVRDALQASMLKHPPKGLPHQTIKAEFFLDMETGELVEPRPVRRTPRRRRT